LQEETRKSRCRILVLGVGHPLMGDDAAGLEAARLLRVKGCSCVEECPGGAELCTHIVRAHSPEILVVVDAALGLEPGEVVVYEGEPGPEWPIVSTHGFPPPLVHRLLADAARRVVYLLLGVEKVELGVSLSVRTAEAVRKAAEVLLEVIDCSPGRARG